MTKPLPAPRLFVVHAKDAPIAVVVQRQPSKHWSLHLWHTDEDRLERGAALIGGKMYPHSMRISPDGRYLAFMQFVPTTGGYQTPETTTFTRGKPWPADTAVISRAPWLYALAAWGQLNKMTWQPEFEKAEKSLPRWPTVRGEPFVLTGGVEQCPYRITDNPMPTEGETIGRDSTAEVSFTWSAKLELPATVGKNAEAVQDFLLAGNPKPRAFPKVPLELAWRCWSKAGSLLFATKDGEIGRASVNGDLITTVWKHRFSEPLASIPAPEWAREW